ncbi:hypothetical protein [Phenylobacterium sp.]|jgi:hypothetical protein|uniref:hypothetical protein n=1 Tax=Phenylobacterium sp. TaxID=1871053 RepID=UPI0011FD1049|nr:hypothetical protein [Phenylobacterium sp.]THD71350.1 MAG: hypothetical protein E8A12_01770 [Phenylobacterium sp.]
MSATRRLVLGASLAALAAPALALDPGVASGAFAFDGAKFDLKHAIALSQDNAEGLLENGPQIRVVLSDIEVPIASLYGVGFPPVLGMAREAAVSGLMLEFAPKSPTAMHVTMLSKPKELGASLTNLSMANSAGIFKRLEVSANRVSGDYDDGSDVKFSFSAPVFTDPVQADLQGPAAQASEQIRVLIARAEALQRGDLPAAVALSSKVSRIGEMPPEVLKQAAQAMPQMIKDLKAVKRVVVRQSTAVALQGRGSWASLVLENGAWKVAD